MPAYSPLDIASIEALSPLELGYKAASLVTAVDPEMFPRPWRAVLTTSWLETQVNNGGFNQYFDEGFDVPLVKFTKEDIQWIGAFAFLDVYERALAVSRDQSLDKASRRIQLGALDHEFDTLMGKENEALPAFLGAFIKAHPELFTK